MAARKTRADRFLDNENKILLLQQKIEALRWEEARLVWEMWDQGMTLTAIAAEVGKSRTHIWVLRKVWTERARIRPGQVFNSFYNSMKTS
jgi:hypothetical protein